MQQAVVSSSQIPPVTTASIALLSLNRHLIQQKISEIINNLSKYIRADTAATISTDSKQSVHTTSNKQNNLQTRQLLTDLLNRQTTVILDSILNSLNNITKKEAKNVTFFQNRHGFTADELLNCEFNEASTKRFNLNSILTKTNRNPTNFLILHNQIRGFKTKRTTQQEDIESKKDIFSDYFNKKAEKTNPAKIINSILTQSRNKNLGSILQSTNANLDADSKVKIAFAEGVLYAKHEDKKPNPSSFLRFLFFVSLIILFTALFPISFSSSSNGGSNTGGGINIRALTGSVNYEVNPEQVTVKFDDVKGLTEAKKELSEIVDFLKEPEKYSKLGARLPKGILLIGPPGCGKTLLAKSVAGEAGVPYFQASGSDFDEMFVGTGSKRVRQLFAAARAKAPCVIFIDEIDSVGSTRTNSAIHPHANQTINQLLAEMDGFQKNEGVIVLGATNRRETLDSALMRPGRFDVEVRIDKPDLKQRIEILDYYLDKVARDDDINVKYLAKQLNGLSASAIENVVNQSALRAVITNGKSVKMVHLEWALDRALMGYGKERIADEECNRNTAYHEAGHVLVAYYTKDSHPLHKVTILPRTQSLGHTAFVPEDEGYSLTKSQLLAQMDVAMGGRVAEEFAFGTEKVTTGASGDFKKATQIAVSMIKMFGMNDKVAAQCNVVPLGLVTCGSMALRAILLKVICDRGGCAAQIGLHRGDYGLVWNTAVISSRLPNYSSPQPSVSPKSIGAAPTSYSGLNCTKTAGDGALGGANVWGGTSSATDSLRAPGLQTYNTSATNGFDGKRVVYIVDLMGPHAPMLLPEGSAAAISYVSINSQASPSKRQHLLKKQVSYVD